MALLNDAGKLRHRCTFYETVEEETKRGTTKLIDKKIFSCWCAFTQNSIKDVKEAMGGGHTIKKTIIIRHRQRGEVNNAMRVETKGVTYEIDQIIPDDNKEEFDTIVLRNKH